MSEDKKEFDSLEFVSQVGKIIEKNFKLVLGLFIAIIVASSVWAYMSNLKSGNEKESFKKLYAITKVYEEKKESFDEAKIAKEEKKEKKDSEEDKVTAVEASGELEKDYPQIVEKLEKFLADHLGDKASGEAALTLSEIYEEYKQPEKGVAALEKAIEKWGSQDIVYYVMQMRAGDLLASQNQCEKALKFWQPITEGSSFMTSQAKLKKGVCLQEIGKLEEAKNIFEEIKKGSGESQGMNPDSFSATRYLRYIQFKMKNSDVPAQSGKAQQNKKDKQKAS